MWPDYLVVLKNFAVATNLPNSPLLSTLLLLFTLYISFIILRLYNFIVVLLNLVLTISTTHSVIEDMDTLINVQYKS
jgi:hypothetical protein